MATICKRIGRNGDVTWQVKVRKKDEKVQTGTFDRKVDAEKWASSLEGDIARGRFVDMTEAERTTLLEALDRYEKEITPEKKGAKQERSRLNLWRRCSFANKGLAHIKSKDIIAWRDERMASGTAANTVKNDLILLSHVFTIAVQEWEIPGLGNPVRQIRKPKSPDGRKVRLPPEEEPKLLAAARNLGVSWLEPIIVLAIETAMRQSEILGLRRSLTNLHNRTTKLPDTKNGTEREVPLSSRAIETLEAIPDDESDRFFHVPVPTLEKYFHKARDAAGLPHLHFHDLRHEATTRLFESRHLNVMEVAAITGHKSLNMLKRYTHPLAKDLAKLLG